MSIRVRLLLSYAAMLVVPLVLILLTTLLLVIVFRGDLQHIRDVYGEKTAQFESQHNDRIMKEIKRSTETAPSLFSHEDYLQELDQELQQRQSGLIVRRDDSLTFVSDSFNEQPLLSSLPSFQRPGYKEGDVLDHLGSRIYSLNQFDFMFPDNHPGSVFIVTIVNPVTEFARKFFPALFVSLLIILVLTHTLLTYFVSRSIIRPLGLLKHAVKQIKEGNLDFRVQVAGKDEIGQLGIAFEEMRTQLKDSIDTQLQYEENRKELISNISHDLKTPITAIKGYVHGMIDGVADTPEKRNKYMKTISAKAEQMDHLIDELFLYSKLDMNRLPFNFERVDMSAFLQDCAEEMQFDLEKKGFRFESHIKLGQRAWVSLDRDKLRRVISNIMDNCVKYSDKPDKWIRLEAFEIADDVVIDISDNGQGINPEDLRHIFDRFYRSDPSRNAQTGGSGLGLAIAKQIIEGHGGKIEATSTVHEGTSVQIYLPVRLG